MLLLFMQGNNDYQFRCLLTCLMLFPNSGKLQPGEIFKKMFSDDTAMEAYYNGTVIDSELKAIMAKYYAAQEARENDYNTSGQNQEEMSKLPGQNDAIALYGAQLDAYVMGYKMVPATQENLENMDTNKQWAISKNLV